MKAVDVLVLVGLLAGVLLAGLATRRYALRRTGGMIDLSLRIVKRRGTRQGWGWVLGLGRYAGDHLLWYRVFSPAMRPRRTFSRRGLTVVKQRRPTGVEALSLLGGSIVVECVGDAGRIELAMSEAALPGFLAWVEAAASRGPGIN